MPNPRFKPLPFGIGRSVDSLHREDERGILYFMDYTADYYLLERFADKIAATPGCSTFLTDNLNGQKLFCRNYDFSHYRFNKQGEPKDITGLVIVVRCANPRAKYKSIGTVDGFWLDFNKGRFFAGAPDDGITDITLLAAAPLAIMDGMNEKGLAVSIMHLPTENEWKECESIDYDSLSPEEQKLVVLLDSAGEEPKRLDAHVKKNAVAINRADGRCWRVNKNFAVNQQTPGKKTLLHPILMRRMLDCAANVEEAIALAKKYNIKSPMPDNDYHILVSDRSGNSVMLEWVENILKITKICHGTNFYLAREDHYGYGYERDEILSACLNKYKNGMNDNMAMEVLQLASQNSPEGSDVGFTQWSGVYNLDELTMKLSVFMDYGKQYEYRI